MPNLSWQQKENLRRRGKLSDQDEAVARAEPAKAAPAPRPAVPAKISQTAQLRTAQRKMIPATYISIEVKPLSAYDDNPVLNERGAAFVVGVSPDLLKKWRQRNQGPDYTQYGQGGPVRYELKALLAFRDYHRVYLSKR